MRFLHARERALRGDLLSRCPVIDWLLADAEMATIRVWDEALSKAVDKAVLMKRMERG